MSRYPYFDCCAFTSLILLLNDKIIYYNSILLVENFSLCMLSLKCLFNKVNYLTRIITPGDLKM